MLNHEIKKKVRLQIKNEIRVMLLYSWEDATLIEKKNSNYVKVAENGKAMGE
jgi:hypothetical protein